jgi:hypothetical protein
MATYDFTDLPMAQTIIPEETRVVSETGGAKGQKECELGDIDPKALWELGRIAGFGARKYTSDTEDGRFNYMKGYNYTSSYNALQRHAMQFWMGEDIDEESNCYHLACVAWHALCLLTFRLRKLGTDDRPK